MSTRIRDLEAALSNTQAQVSPQPHPLLRDSERLKEIDPNLYEDVESPSRDYVEEASDLIGSLSIGDQGQTRFHGQSSASEFLQTLLPGSEDDPVHGTLHSGNVYKMGLPLPIIDLINAFPFNAVTTDTSAKSIILRFLPHHSKALALTLAYLEHAACSYQVIQEDEFVPSLLGILLRVSNGLTIGESLHSHQVALIYLVLAMGAHLSEDDGGEAGEKYYHLACAALSLNPIMKEATSTTLQALFIMVQYFNCVDSPSCERRWLMGGVMFRLSYSIGLQRDPSLWHLSPEETQRRRTLYWEVYTWDAWNSILHGRPPSLNINYTDCRFPEDKSSVCNDKGESEMGFESYKYRFAAFILAPVINHVFGVRELNYASLLDIDIKLRKLVPPSWLLAPTRGKGEPVDGRAWNSNSVRAMQQYSIVSSRESTLLYIHRRYFATAIKLNSVDPLKTKYGASVMAACRSACLLLSSLRSLYGAHPNLAVKQSFFWSGAFSACIVLGCLVYNSPGCSLANDALHALNDGVELYSMRIFDDSSSSVKLLSSVRDRVRRMFEKYHNFHDGEDPEDESSLDCSAMRVLEGSTILVNLNDIKSKTPSSSGSGDSSASSQADSPAIPVIHDETNYGPQVQEVETWPSCNGCEETMNAPDYKVFDFSGVYSGVSLKQQLEAPLVAPPSVYSPLDVTANGHHVSSAVDVGVVDGMSSGTGVGVRAGSTAGLRAAQNPGAIYSMPVDYETGDGDATMPPYAGLGLPDENIFERSFAMSQKRQ
ncbi:hypothetical protein EW145_g1121 [Phellinidium pouzarii]|uniref:Xylanolytic transcriptional activator regulatory domain-containing protein n=1 Tax=Phellinidium pouzarii TaxID=167371 RepID=A0A4S4LHH9_9AGAM|nr:hypothetical protein EW145_g1121 [Phellinidium pouzarii]